jgi:uncharacterized protein (DUF1778 family)
MKKTRRTRTERINIRLTTKEYKTVELAAKHYELNPSEFVRMAALEFAKPIQTEEAS